MVRGRSCGNSSVCWIDLTWVITNRGRYLLFPVAGLVALSFAATASAHTDSDFVAVPAGSEATVRFKPTHGCGESPTVQVRVRAPLLDAEARPVDGWTESSEPDDEGNTVLTWSGGELPTDETGEFPITFIVPDTVGELLVFPAIQDCANDDELAWIDGDPESEYPAPRLLVLEAEAEPAEGLDDIADDAPGRELLTNVIEDIDNPNGVSAETVIPDNSGPPTVVSTSEA
jgi:uncharacterized protein YcnI